LCQTKQHDLDPSSTRTSSAPSHTWLLTLAVRERAHRPSYHLGRQTHDERRNLGVLHCLSIYYQLDAHGHQSGRLKPLQVHVEQRATHADLARELADVLPPPHEGRHDTQPVWIAQGRQHPQEFVSGEGWRRLLPVRHLSIPPITCQVFLTPDRSP